MSLWDKSLDVVALFQAAKPVRVSPAVYIISMLLQNCSKEGAGGLTKYIVVDGSADKDTKFFAVIYFPPTLKDGDHDGQLSSVAGVLKSMHWLGPMSGLR